MLGNFSPRTEIEDICLPKEAARISTKTVATTIFSSSVLSLTPEIENPEVQGPSSNSFPKLSCPPLTTLPSSEKLPNEKCRDGFWRLDHAVIAFSARLLRIKIQAESTQTPRGQTVLSTCFASVKFLGRGICRARLSQLPLKRIYTAHCTDCLVYRANVVSSRSTAAAASPSTGRRRLWGPARNANKIYFEAVSKNKKMFCPLKSLSSLHACVN